MLDRGDPVFYKPDQNAFIEIFVVDLHLNLSLSNYMPPAGQ